MDVRLQVKVITTIGVEGKDYCSRECSFYVNRWCVLFLTPLKHKGQGVERCEECKKL